MYRDSDEELGIGLADEVHWKVMQAYANQALRWGVTRWADEILESREYGRRYRRWLVCHHNKRERYLRVAEED